MQQQISFALSQPLPLPDDIHIWVPAKSVSHDLLLHPVTGRKPWYLHVADTCDGVSCGKCNCADVATNTNYPVSALANSFLAISPKSASYVVLDAGFIQQFMLLRDGKSPREVESSLPNIIEWRKFVRRLVELMVLRNFLANTSTREDKPQRPTLHLYVTNRCNLRCTHCYMSSGRPLPQGELDHEGRIAAIDGFTALGKVGRVSFSGGEAMTDPKLFELVEHAKQSGHSVELYTNGLLVNEKTAQKIVNLVDELQISLDGATSDANDPIRGSGTFSRIVRAINYIDAADRSLNPGFIYRIGLTLTEGNKADLENSLLGMLNELDLKNAHLVKVGVVSKLGRAKDNGAIVKDVDELSSVQARIMSNFVASGRMRFPNLQVNLYSTTCGIGSAITVSADGKVFPCTITDQPALGDLKDGDALSLMRAAESYMELTKVDNVAGCSDCSLRYFCQGMCRITNLNKTGSMLKSDCPPSYKAGKVSALMSGFGSFLH